MRFISYKLFTTALLISLTVSNVFSIIIIYVSPKGNDHNPSIINSPLARIAVARDKVGSISQVQRNASPIEVMIEQGDYFLNELLVFSSEDSGTETAPVIYLAKGKINPVINGSKVLPRFEQVSLKLRNITYIAYRLTFSQLAEKHTFSIKLCVIGLVVYSPES